MYVNGLNLETTDGGLADENLRDGADIVEPGRSTISGVDYVYDFSFPRSDGKPNPHRWTDPLLALALRRIVSADLSGRDPGNAAYYAANYRRFAADRALDKAMRVVRDDPPTRAADVPLRLRVFR